MAILDAPGVSVSTDQTIRGAKTFNSSKGLRTTTWFGIGAGVGSARNPFYMNTIVDGSAISNTLAAGGGDDYVGVQMNIKFQGGFQSLKTMLTGGITSGSNILTLTSGTFTSPVDVGFTVNIPGAGPGGGQPLKTKIVSITDTTHAVLAASASVTVSGASITATLAADASFLFAANDFFTTGTAVNDLSGIDNLYGRLTEMHLYTPGSVLSSMLGFQTQANVEASATGSTIGSIYSIKAYQPTNAAGAVITNAYGLYSSGTPTPGATNSWGLYVDGGGKTKLTGPTTLTGMNAADVPLVVQQPLGHTGEAIQLWDFTFVNKRFHVTNGGAVGSSSFMTSFEGLSQSTAIGSMTNGKSGIHFGNGGSTEIRLNNTAGAIEVNGKLAWVAANEQTTVGAAGAGAALPATPTKYLTVVDSTGTTLVVPAYAAV